MEIDKEVLKRVIDKFGADQQIKQAIEEMCELIVAIRHFERGKADKIDIFNEIADVQIMIEQLKIIFFGEMKELEIIFNDTLAGRIENLKKLAGKKTEENPIKYNTAEASEMETDIGDYFKNFPGITPKKVCEALREDIEYWEAVSSRKRSDTWHFRQNKLCLLSDYNDKSHTCSACIVYAAGRHFEDFGGTSFMCRGCIPIGYSDWLSSASRSGKFKYEVVPMEENYTMYIRSKLAAEKITLNLRRILDAVLFYVNEKNKNSIEEGSPY